MNRTPKSILCEENHNFEMGGTKEITEFTKECTELTFGATTPIRAHGQTFKEF